MDIGRLLTPIKDDLPSGVELRNDARFHSIERRMDPAARDARHNPDGSVSDAVPNVDWQGILDDGQALAEDGRDLRLLTILVRALYNVGGFSDLAQGLGLLTDSVTQFWDSLHPALRERDDAKAAALPRLNAIRQLENDENGLLGDLRFGIMLNARGIGPLTGDDLAAGTQSDFEMLNQAASGLNQAEKDALVAAHGQRVNRVTAATRALAAEEAERAADMLDGLKACEAAIAALTAAVDDKGGFGSQPGLSLTELASFLQLCRKTIEKAVAATGTDATLVEDSPAAVAPAGQATPVSAASASGTINSRRDVETSLDRIIGFYERTEPSSPIPHLARRMRRMVAMDFLELMEEIAPSGLKEFRSIAGVDEPKKK
ncbi:type VI secretion system protein TssA [Puniceibacterium sp. IMCC21224]|uniref:type VI secretion system protein TssA n=1 Tax=Puniceibacterium sp. IMCC21224 TaxID=1618204 RepID=UPI00064DDB30|nr:type VI secretion system protein TssA [Puniceibacterium sp. IMCC21224]KMK65238.1 type VI secretion-associated protein, ImpA family [Puniceibacterium sp. IMCC21224]